MFSFRQVIFGVMAAALGVLASPVSGHYLWVLARWQRGNQGKCEHLF